MTPDETGNDSAMEELNYTVTTVELHIHFKKSYVETVSELHYHTATENNRSGKPLILTIRSSTDLQSVSINENYVNSTLSSSGRVLIIRKPPHAGVIKITTRVSMLLVMDLPGVINCDDNLFFKYLHSNLKYLTYFTKDSHITAKINIKISCHYIGLSPIVIHGSPSAINFKGQHEDKTIEVKDIKNISENIILMLSVVSYAHLQKHYSSKERNVLINLVCFTSYLSAGDFATDLIHACCAWYEQTLQTTLPIRSFTMLSIKAKNHYHILTNNVLLSNDFTCLPTNTENTDAMLIYSVELLSEAFFESICMQTGDNKLKAQQLAHDFLNHYFQRSIQPEYIAEQDPKKSILNFFKVLEGTEKILSQRNIPEEIASQFAIIIRNNSISDFAKAELLSMPTLETLADNINTIDIDRLQRNYRTMAGYIGAILEHEWLNIYYSKFHSAHDGLTSQEIGRRKLMNLALWYLLACREDALKLSYQQIVSSSNINDRCSAFTATAYFHDLDPAELDEDIVNAITVTNCNHSVIDVTLLLMATLHDMRVYDVMYETLEGLNPLQQYIMLRHFVKYNWQFFHHENGYGYSLLINMMGQIDTMDPELACTLLQELNIVLKLDRFRKQTVCNHLADLINSKDTYSGILSDGIEILQRNLISSMHMEPAAISPRHHNKKAAFPAFSLNNSETWFTPSLKQAHLPPSSRKLYDERIAIIQSYHYEPEVKKSSSIPATQKPKFS